jgi:hypothetical protein
MKINLQEHSRHNLPFFPGRPAHARLPGDAGFEPVHPFMQQPAAIS